MKQKRYYTIKEIENMSEEEVAALNRRALRNLALFFGFKWGIMFAINRYARKVYKEHTEIIIQKEQ